MYSFGDMFVFDFSSRSSFLAIFDGLVDSLSIFKTGENAKTKGDAKSFKAIVQTIQIHSAKRGKTKGGKNAARAF